MGRISVVRLIAAAVVISGMTSCGSFPYVRSAPERPMIRVDETGTLSDTPDNRGALYKCYAALREAADPYGVVSIAIGSAGIPRVTSAGVVAPYLVTLVFNRDGGLETRMGLINCRLNTAGTVVALDAAPDRP
jgi:hypothetical protein